MKRFLNGFIFVFLIFNLVIRFGTIFNYPPYNGFIAGFFGLVVAACFFVVIRPRYLKYLLFIFGFSFFLYGFGSIDIQSRIFELLVTVVAFTLFVINYLGRSQGSGVRNQNIPLNRPLLLLLLCYVGLSAFSLLLLPVRQILRDLWYFGFPDFFFYLFIGPPHSFYYSISAVLRLTLFGVLAVELAKSASSRELFRWLFFAVFLGAVFCAILGLLDFYEIIPLKWFRMGTTKLPGVLHSTFLNSGWFAEFILVAVPFVLIGMQRAKSLFSKLSLISTLIICEIALIFCAARAGWVSYPLILIFCWIFFYFSKEGRLESLRFKWKDLVKIGISVPMTIVVSLVLVFYLLMPVLDTVRDKENFRGIGKDKKNTTEFIEHEASTVFNPYSSSRPWRWRQGFNIGMESPLFGVGYESYARHALILSDLPTSAYAKVNYSNAQTSHGTLFQIFVNGGIVGVCLWVLLIGYAFILLIVDFIKNKRLLNIPVMISIIAFHAYGIFQSMQYIPMIWSMIFLCLGYAMTLEGEVLPKRLREVVSKVVVVAMIVVGISFFFYLYNFESRNLADKYGLNAYALEQNRDRFAGFYQTPKRKKWRYGDYRWCGKRGAIYFRTLVSREPRAMSGKVQSSKLKAQRKESLEPSNVNRKKMKNSEIEFCCMTPRLDKEPVVVKVSHNGQVLDRIVFKDNVNREPGAVSRKGDVSPSEIEKAKAFHGVNSEQRAVNGKAESPKVKAERKQAFIVDCGGKKGKKHKGCTVTRKYELAGPPGDVQKLVIEVSRTWIPHEVLGNFDRREMGIGVKIIKPEN